MTTSRSRGRGAGRRRRSKRVEVLAVGEGVGQLAGPVGAEVRVDDRVAVANAAVDAVDDGRRDELVVLAAGVGRLDRRGRGRGARSPTPWTIAS